MVACAIVLGVVLVLGVWLAFDVIRVRRALLEAGDRAGQLSEQVRTGTSNDDPEVADRLQASIGHADAITHGPIWSLSKHLPIISHDFDAAAQATRTLDEIARRGIPALNELAKQRDSGALSVTKGRLDLTALRTVGPTLDRAEEVLADGRAQLAAEDISGVHGPLRKVLGTIRTQIDSAENSIRTISDAVALAPDMLGASGPRNYLLVFQNNAEVRATGGLPGAFAQVRANNGAIDLVSQGAASQLGFFVPPAIRLHPDESALYGTLAATVFADSNFTPDFPRTATIMRAMYRIRFGVKLDGVISIDPIAIAQLLAVTGPIRVGPSLELSSDNVIPALLNAVYARYPGNDDAQNAFFAATARKVFGVFVAGGASPAELFSAVSAGVQQNRILINATRADEQAVIARTRLSGALPHQPTRTPQVGLYLNDATAAKLEYFLRRSTVAKAVSCTSAGVQTIKTVTHLQSVAPKDVVSQGPSVVGTGSGATHGVMSMVLNFYAPYGGRVTALTIDGITQTVNVAMHDGLSVATLPILLAPGHKHVVTAVIQSGPGERKNAVFRTTPGVEPTPNNVPVLSACR
ncbi:MAG: hypothetical protein JWP74_3642 [Marmoricola sp.]|nr:hypothetical protein [Marmoricola sp.]